MNSHIISNDVGFIDNFHNSILVKNYLDNKLNFTNSMPYDLRMNDEAKNFSRNLDLLMKYHRDTQASLEKRSGVSQKTISNMLNPGDDRSPNLSNVALIAAAYKIKTWHLLLPDASIEVLMNISVEKLIDNYNHIDKESRDTVLRVAEDSARRHIRQPEIELPITPDRRNKLSDNRGH